MNGEVNELLHYTSRLTENHLQSNQLEHHRIDQERKPSVLWHLLAPGLGRSLRMGRWIWKTSSILVSQHLCIRCWWGGCTRSCYILGLFPGFNTQWLQSWQFQLGSSSAYNSKLSTINLYAVLIYVEKYTYIFACFTTSLLRTCNTLRTEPELVISAARLGEEPGILLVPITPLVLGPLDVPSQA